MTQPSFWLVIALVGVGTLVLRLAPILAHGRVPAPSVVQRLLAYAPAAAMAVLAVPGALYLKGAGDAYVLAPDRILASAVALVVAYRSRNMVLTLAVGMVALWLAQAVL